jgi:hypothetical protein
MSRQGRAFFMTVLTACGNLRCFAHISCAGPAGPETHPVFARKVPFSRLFVTPGTYIGLNNHSYVFKKVVSVITSPVAICTFNVYTRMCRPFPGAYQVGSFAVVAGDAFLFLLIFFRISKWSKTDDCEQNQFK